MLLVSMQELLVAMCSLGVILGLDFLGRLYIARREASRLVGIPLIVVVVLGTVLGDWLLSQVGWWALITNHMVYD